MRASTQAIKVSSPFNPNLPTAIIFHQWYIVAMKFEELLKIVQAEPVFETALLLAGDRHPGDIRRQLSRWTAAGRIYQLRRGLYALAPPYRKVTPHPFLVANRLVLGSYISLQSALAFHGMIPEHVALTTSISAGRPYRWQTPLGNYDFRHMRRELLGGFELTPLSGGQMARVATPEKALLDLIYLEAKADSTAYLEELRLQHLETLRLEDLVRLASRFAKPKLRRAAERIRELAIAEVTAYEVL